MAGEHRIVEAIEELEAASGGGADPGTAGSPSAEVLSVQGVPGGTVVPISGTVTSNPSGDHTVVGKAAAGSAAAGNPVLVAGSESGNVRTLNVDSSGRPVVIVSTTQPVVTGVAGGTAVSGTTPNSDNKNAVITAFSVATYEYSHGGEVAGSVNTFSRNRHPRFFKTVRTAASGNTALWTPTSGTKFNVLRGYIQVSGGATSDTQEIDIELRDGTTNSIGIAASISLPTSITTLQVPAFVIPFEVGPVGIISAADNNVLNVNLSAALTAGFVRVFVCGTEE